MNTIMMFNIKYRATIKHVSYYRVTSQLTQLNNISWSPCIFTHVVLVRHPQLAWHTQHLLTDGIVG